MGVYQQFLIASAVLCSNALHCCDIQLELPLETYQQNSPLHQMNHGWLKAKICFQFEGVSSSKAANTTCFPFRVYCRLVRLDASSHCVFNWCLTGLTSRACKNVFSSSFVSLKCISSELVLTGDGMYIEHGVSGLSSASCGVCCLWKSVLVSSSFCQQKKEYAICKNAI